MKYNEHRDISFEHQGKFPGEDEADGILKDT